MILKERAFGLAANRDKGGGEVNTACWRRSDAGLSEATNEFQGRAEGPAMSLQSGSDWAGVALREPQRLGSGVLTPFASRHTNRMWVEKIASSAPVSKSSA